MLDWRGIGEQALPILGIAALACGLTLGALKLTGNLPTRPAGGALSGDQVVVFDIIKYNNAQRAVASKLLGAAEGERLEAGSMLMELGRRARGTIEKIAGPNRVVLVKQAVLVGAAPDITDAVLLELGLPTDVATVSPADVLGDTAPTWLSLSIRAQQRAAGPSGATRDAGRGNTAVLP